MKITNIKQQLKRNDRYSIYVDGKYAFSFSESELLNSGLRAGLKFDEAGLAELKNRAAQDRAYDRALNRISYRPRSEWEIRDYLKRKDTPAEVIDTIVTRLKKYSYLDDQDFAKRWVANRRLLKSTSKRRLSQELRQKRVADDIIKQVLSDDETDEQQVLRELIERKRKQLKYQDNLKLMQYLSRQGYNYDDIKNAINDD